MSTSNSLIEIQQSCPRILPLDDYSFLIALVGKFIVAFVPVCREKEYYLACACDEIYCPPSGYISLFGFTVQASFLRGTVTMFGLA